MAIPMIAGPSLIASLCEHCLPQHS
ncbi:hypothetical protein P4S72_10030 [Vibrio sp. PP-XX7]